MLGIFKDSDGFCFFHHFAGIHHDDALGDLCDHAQIVGNHHDGGIVICSELQHQVKDLGLNGDIEGSGGLIGDQYFRVAGQRHGDHSALAHPAGKLMWIFMHSFFRSGNLNLFKHLNRAVPAVAFGLLFMQDKHFRYLITDGVNRIQRGHRFLENHGDALAANRSHLFHGKLNNIGAVKQNLALDDFARWLGYQTHDGLRRYAFTAAGFSHNTEHLAFVDMK